MGSIGFGIETTIGRIAFWFAVIFCQSHEAVRNQFAVTWRLL
jgi:hypothetical protein